MSGGAAAVLVLGLEEEVVALFLAMTCARSSFIWGTLETMMRSTRASAMRRTPQNAKGD